MDFVFVLVLFGDKFFESCQVTTEMSYICLAELYRVVREELDREGRVVLLI